MINENVINFVTDKDVLKLKINFVSNKIFFISNFHNHYSFSIIIHKMDIQNKKIKNEI